MLSSKRVPQSQLRLAAPTSIVSHVPQGLAQSLIAGSRPLVELHLKRIKATHLRQRREEMDLARERVLQ